ncbi:MAG: hypothetical protein EXS22_07780 [Pedosphaera sp.]|nr:hypothetical protein [Pedosphaera sp.]MSU43922.1 hypothetical protein [Pedosphaera sp.]
MSLKAFHIFFIVVSIFLGLGVGGWGILQFAKGQGVSWLYFGLGFIVSGVALIFYSRSILKKMKDISYL